jgi:ABC-type phosphate transport system substrate-binding protein
MKGLSAEAQAQAQLAAGKLKEVRSTIDQIEGQIGIIEGAFVKNDAENVRNLAARLLEELDSAQRATQNVANIYQVSTKLDAQK